MKTQTNWRDLHLLLARYGLEALGDYVLLQRAASVSFLGLADYSQQASARVRPSRYDHTVGVVRLLHAFASGCDLPVEHRRAGLVAAVLHDVGHYPLSHSLEPTFAERFGLSHRETILALLAGDVAGRPELELETRLQSLGVAVDRIRSILDPKACSLDPLAPLFYGALNLDTIDAILRAAEYGNVGVERKLQKMGPNVLLSLLSWNEARQQIVIDTSKRKRLVSFFTLKARVYEDLIYSDHVRSLERAARLALEDRLAVDDSLSWQDVLMWGDLDLVDWLSPSRNGQRAGEALGDLESRYENDPRETRWARKEFSTHPQGDLPRCLPLSDLGQYFPRTVKDAIE